MNIGGRAGLLRDEFARAGTPPRDRRRGSMELAPFRSLRFKLALWVALSILTIGAAITTWHYRAEQARGMARLESVAAQLGKVAAGSVRAAILQAMVEHDPTLLKRMLSDLSGQEGVVQTLVLSADGEIWISTQAHETGDSSLLTSFECLGCHKATPSVEARTGLITLPSIGQVFRNSQPIYTGTECQQCHSPDTEVLGTLITDFSLTSLRQEAAQNLRENLLRAAASTLLGGLAVFVLTHWLVVRRVEKFQEPLRRFARGDLSSRVPPLRGADELSVLAGAVNQMAEDLERKTEAERRAKLREQTAILEERKRIARELHDGLAQVLGYVNTKAMAVRLNLQAGRFQKAVEQVCQLEAASQSVHAEVREAILGLRTAATAETGLVPALQEYVTLFSELSDIPTEIDLGPGAEHFDLPVECRVQLLRIVQEALANVRKHACASRAWVRVAPNGGQSLQVEIGDDGRGFDLGANCSNSHAHFGLSTMRERSEAVGGRLEVNSSPGSGTRVVVTMNLGSGKNGGFGP